MSEIYKKMVTEAMAAQRADVDTIKKIEAENLK